MVYDLGFMAHDVGNNKSLRLLNAHSELKPFLLTQYLPGSHGSRSDNDYKCTMILGKVCIFVQGEQGFLFEDMPTWWFQFWWHQRGSLTTNIASQGFSAIPKSIVDDPKFENLEILWVYSRMFLGIRYDKICVFHGFFFVNGISPNCKLVVWIPGISLCKGILGIPRYKSQTTGPQPPINLPSVEYPPGN